MDASESERQHFKALDSGQVDINCGAVHGFFCQYSWRYCASRVLFYVQIDFFLRIWMASMTA